MKGAEGTMAIAARIQPKIDNPIAPFDEAAARFSFCDRPLADLQRQEAEAAGFELVDVSEGEALPQGTEVAFSADCFVTAGALKLAQVGATKSARAQLVVTGQSPLFTFLYPHSHAGAVSDQGLRLPVFAGELAGKVAEGDVAERWFDDAIPTLLTDAEADVDRTDPYGKPSCQLRIPASERMAGRITHWLHALNLSLSYLSLFRRRHGATGRKNHLLGEAKIHPTALVEGSVIADGAEIEAGASVIDSYIGPKVKIADHAIFARCAVDTGCHTLIDTHMRRVIAYEGSTLSNLGTTDLLLGRKIFITTGVAYFHPGPKETIFVDGQDALRPVLGGAVGHGAILGARSLFPAGQAVPSGMTIVGRPDEAISRLTPEGLERAHAQHGDPQTDA